MGAILANVYRSCFREGYPVFLVFLTLSSEVAAMLRTLDISKKEDRREEGNR